MRAGYIDAAPLIAVMRQRASECSLGLEAFARMRFGENAARNVSRWAAGQPIRIGTADRYAVAVGLHPANVWPDWYAVSNVA